MSRFLLDVEFKCSLYLNPEWGFKPGSLSEFLLEFDTCSKLLGHHAGLRNKVFLSKFFLSCTFNVGQILPLKFDAYYAT